MHAPQEGGRPFWTFCNHWWWNLNSTNLHFMSLLSVLLSHLHFLMQLLIRPWHCTDAVANTEISAAEDCSAADWRTVASDTVAAETSSAPPPPLLLQFWWQPSLGGRLPWADRCRVSTKFHLFCVHVRISVCISVTCGGCCRRVMPQQRLVMWEKCHSCNTLDSKPEHWCQCLPAGLCTQQIAKARTASVGPNAFWGPWQPSSGSSSTFCCLVVNLALRHADVQ